MCMQSFVHDPLIEWRLSFSGQRASLQGTADEAGVWQRKAYASIFTIQQKLRGAVTALPVGALDGSVSSEQGPLVPSRELSCPGTVSAQSVVEREESTSSAASSAESDLSDPGGMGGNREYRHREAAAPGGTLTVSQQVNALIRAATLYENLARMYVGWLPWY